MDIKFSNRQEDAATLVLAGLQSELETYLRRPVEVTEHQEQYVIPADFVALPNDSFFWSASLATTTEVETYVGPSYLVALRNSPVVSVDTVTLTPGVYPGMSTRTLEAGRDFVVRRFGIELWNPAANDRVDVTYTAGLDGEQIPYLKLVILRAAAREMQNMHDDVVGVKDLETRNVAPLQTGFTDEERASLRRWRRVRVG